MMISSKSNAINSFAFSHLPKSFFWFSVEKGGFVAVKLEVSIVSTFHKDVEQAGTRLEQDRNIDRIHVPYRVVLAKSQKAAQGWLSIVLSTACMRRWVLKHARRTSGAE